MDLSFTEEQEALRGLAREVFAGHCTDERLREIGSGSERYDLALWEALARANVLGAGTPEAAGGIGGGLIEVCMVCEEAGRATAPVPLGPALVGALALARAGRTQEALAFVEGGAPVVPALGDDPFTPTVIARDDRLTGTVSFVPAAARAAAIIVPTDVGVFLVEPGSATVDRQQPTGTEPLYRVTLDGVPSEPIDLDHASFAQTAIVALCAEQVGVAEAALRLTAAYTSGREQFGKPIGSFQAVQQRAADAYIDVEAMRWTMWEAAWRLDEGLAAAEHVEIAKVWASEGAARVLAAAQHLHGGMGVDLDYPLHRYTFAARRNELALGGAAPHLARLGDLIA